MLSIFTTSPPRLLSAFCLLSAISRGSTNESSYFRLVAATALAVWGLHVRLEIQKSLGFSRVSSSGDIASCCSWLWGGLQMTTYVALFLAAWAAGFAIGFQVRIIRIALKAAG